MNSGSNNTETYTFGISGTHPVGLRITTDQGCQDTTTNTVTVDTIPIAIFIADQVCQGTATTVDASGSTVASGTIDQYEWDFDNDGSYEVNSGSNNTRTYTFGTSGTHTVGLRITTDQGCQDTTTNTVTVDASPVVFYVTGGSSYCTGDLGVQVGLSNSETGIEYQLKIDGSNIGNPVEGTGSPLTWPDRTEGIYKVVATNPLTECSVLMNDSIVVTENYLPKLSFEYEHVNCFGESDGFIVLTVSEGSPPYTYSWIGPDDFSSSYEDISNLSPGTYNIIVTDSKSCSSGNQEIIINEPSQLTIVIDTVTGLSTLGGSDGEIYVSIIGGIPPYTVNWTGPGQFLSNSEDISGLKMGSYSITVSDSNLCSVSISDIIITMQGYEADVFIPEGFSPNGDGFNDFFVIIGIENYPDNELIVFNRSGVEIYRKKNYLNDWDGKPTNRSLIGKQLPVGTYFYILHLGESRLTKKGYLYLNSD